MGWMLSKFRLPVLSTVPRSGTWFLRYAVSYLCHLERGGRIEDAATGRLLGSPEGPSFGYDRFKGGPLFRVRGTLPYDHLFIGHAVCPGFAETAGAVDWWTDTRFHVRGYDYFHEGLDYRRTPVDLADYINARVNVRALERSASKGRAAPIALVYRNPIDQAASYFRYCQEHRDPTYSLFQGRPLVGMEFRDYLVSAALPSYAKQFISFQEMARRHPHLVKLVSYERLMEDPVTVLGELLDHLAGAPRKRPFLADAVWLARRDHMKEVERKLGRSLDGTRTGLGSHMRAKRSETPLNEALVAETVALLRSQGVDTALFDWPVAKRTASAA
ncbi:MAG: sulfotransferase domain-containing protein [Pseudomonadota bacterium]